MDFVKIAGILWGMFYMGMAVNVAFDFKPADTWQTVACLILISAPPLPSAFAALWTARAPGIILLCSTVVCMVLILLAGDRDLKLFGGMLCLPHLVFGTAYLIIARIQEGEGLILLKIPPPTGK